MSILDSFRPFNFNEGVPYVSITTSGITFNKAVVMKLGYPRNVILLIDDHSNRLALQPCGETEPLAAPFFKEKKSGVISVRWNGKDLINTIVELTGWDLKKCGYRVDGFLVREENVMLFNLNEAMPLS